MSDEAIDYYHAPKIDCKPVRNYLKLSDAIAHYLRRGYGDALSQEWLAKALGALIQMEQAQADLLGRIERVLIHCERNLDDGK